MKIDLITLHGVANYGSVLQAYATQEILRELGCEVQVINYVKKENRYENLLDFWCGKNIIKKMVMLPTIIRWKKVFPVFNSKYLQLTKEMYTAESDFKSYQLVADAYCTGSDQVWNSVWNKGVLKPLYLTFVPSTEYKFAFSASFGQEKLDNKEVEETSNYLREYNKISVREQTAVKIFEEQYGRDDVVRLLDPTLSMSASFWRNIAGKRLIKEKYIFIYNLNRSKAFDDYAKKLAKKTGYKLVRLCYRYDQCLRVGKSIIAPKVEDFISLIDNAEFVLTDSFHATAFSMNMNTTPICIYPSEFGGRLKDFLELVDSTHRHPSNYDDFSVISSGVDFKKVNNILNNERIKTRQFLSSVIDEIRLQGASHDK